MKIIQFSLLYAFVCLYSILNSTIWHIKLDGSGDFTTIQEGIAASTDSDTVLVYPGTYYENLNFNGRNIVLASLELTTGDEQYISSTIIDGQRLESCIRIHNGETDARIQGFTIQNGFGTQFWANDGGGLLIHDYSTAYVTNCTFTNNLAAQGGGIYARHGFLHLSGLRIIENYASWGGAIFLADDSTVNFDADNRCNLYNNNASKGSEIFTMDTANIHVVVDTFAVFNPDRFFAEYVEEATYTFDIQNNWMELEPNDLYVAVDGDDTNSGLTPDEPFKNISWAVRKIQADEQNPRTVYVAAGTYSHEINEQIYPIGCKEYVSIIGEDMETTILYNDFTMKTINGYNLNGTVEISNFTVTNSFEYEASTLMYFRNIDELIISDISLCNNTSIRRIIVTEYVYNIFDNLIISDNIAIYNAGLSLAGNAGIMKNCIIENNESTVQTPDECTVAMQLMAYDNFTIENCIFSGNFSTNNESRIIRTTNHNGGDPTIRFNNCLISDNSIGSRYVFQNFNYDGLTEFNNCTFSNNTASSNFYPTTLYSYGDINMTNTIMHDNTDYEIFMVDDTQYGYTYELNVENCNIKNGEDGVYNMNNANIINWGEGNINEDPLFLLSGDDPYQLTIDSPCVDTGTPETTGLFLPPWDLLHNQRIWDGDGDGTAIIDMGCYEFGADAVGSIDDPLPIIDYQLTNYPNPFNPETTIVFNLPEEGEVKLDIYNIKGQKVKSLVNDQYLKGNHSIIWDGTDTTNKSVSSGIYMYQLKVNDKIEKVKKMMLLK